MAIIDRTMDSPTSPSSRPTPEPRPLLAYRTPKDELQQARGKLASLRDFNAPDNRVVEGICLTMLTLIFSLVSLSSSYEQFRFTAGVLNIGLLFFALACLFMPGFRSFGVGVLIMFGAAVLLILSALVLGIVYLRVR